MPWDSRLVVHGDFKAEAGAEAVDRLLAGEAAFTAVLCVSDLAALGVLRRLSERGIRVPEEVSVAGFDDVSLAAQPAPSLSTVRVPLHDLGLQAYRRVESILAGRRPRRKVRATEVVLRGSTAGPPAVPLPRRAGG